MKTIKKLKSSDGFTIIELLIATAVLSTMLVMVTMIMINIGRLYYKGINQARVQDNTRTVADDIAQHLKLGDNFFHVGSGTTGAYCLRSTRYTYVLYRQVSDSPDATQTRHALWRDTITSSGSCPLADLNNTNPSQGTDVGGGNAQNGAELITPNARLMAFLITGTSTYTITVKEAYGDNDLICDVGPSAPVGDCTVDGVSSHMNDIITNGTSPSGDIRCKGMRGDQFCATAGLTTTMVRRLP